jgi:DNA-binding MarR family transcriptional regulator
MADESLDLSELRACFAFRAHRFERQVSALYDAAIAPSGLTARQFNLLSHAAAIPGLSVARLAQRLLVDPTTLTRNLKPLVEKGWLRLDADAADGRAKRIFATGAGLARLKAALPLWRTAQDAVAEALGDSAADRLAQALEKATGRLRAAATGDT